MLEKTKMWGLPSPKIPPATEYCVKWEVDVTLNVDDIAVDKRPTADDAQFCKLWQILGDNVGYDSKVTFTTPGDEAHRDCESFLDIT